MRKDTRNARRSRSIEFGRLIVLIGLVGLTGACATRSDDTQSKAQFGANIDRAADAYRAYARGDCETVQAGAETDQVRTWQIGEARSAYQLLDAFCDELDGNLEGAQNTYRRIVREAPLSFAADDASERLRILRLSRADEDYARNLELARQSARSGSTRRAAVERDPASYPPIAHRAGVEGHAVVEFKVTPDGLTETPIVIDSVPPLLFDGVALRAIRQWRYASDASEDAIDRQAIRLVFRPEDSEPAPTRAPDADIVETAVE